MIVQRALHLGMCFGVRDAIALAKSEATKGPLTVLGDLVHNETVLEDLRRRGVRIERRLDSVTTDRLMITAHGASETRLREVHQRGHNVLEATCPLVRFAHDRVAHMVRDGYHPVIIGQRDHVEVRGLTEDLVAFDVVLSEDDIRTLAPRARFGVAAQTTQPLPRVHALLAALRRRFPEAEVRFADTVCLPTKQRQKAAEEIAMQSDVVLVVGGPQSNNTRELVATCGRFCARVHHVQSAADLSPAWFRSSDRVGITAGTSTPDVVVDGIETWLRRLDEAWDWNDATGDAPRTETKTAVLVPIG
jgi:4-hydroxy-3-methylbut-2-enyl diphosphate reductase